MPPQDQISAKEFGAMVERIDNLAESVDKLVTELRGNGKPGMIADVRRLSDWQQRHDDCEKEKKATWKSLVMPVASKFIEYGVFGLIAWAVVNIPHKP